MSNLLNSMKAGYTGFVEDGQFLMLFMAALLLLWIIEDSSKKELRTFGLTILLVLLFPITAKILIIYQTAFYDYEDLWQILPVTAILAYGLMIAFFKMTAALTREYGRWKSATPKRKEHVYEVVTVLILTSILFLCGTLSPAKEVTAKAENAERIPKTVVNVLDVVKTEEGLEEYILSPDEIMTWARIYSSDILLPYGRDFIEPELSAYTYDIYNEDTKELHDWVNDTLPTLEDDKEDMWQEEMYLSTCSSNGYQYLVVTKEHSDRVNFQKAIKAQKEYELLSEVEGFVIYKLP